MDKKKFVYHHLLKYNSGLYILMQDKQIILEFMKSLSKLISIYFFKLLIQLSLMLLNQLLKKIKILILFKRDYL